MFACQLCVCVFGRERARVLSLKTVSPMSLVAATLSNENLTQGPQIINHLRFIQPKCGFIPILCSMLILHHPFALTLSLGAKPGG